MEEINIPLFTIAHARSGDKGSSSNIGVIAHTKQAYDFLEHFLDAEKVSRFFHALQPAAVKRYALPNLLAFNFILEGVLDGGGSRSLRIDAQGKALGQAILEMDVSIPRDLYEKIKLGNDSHFLPPSTQRTQRKGHR
jgi:hypothetical protein